VAATEPERLILRRVLPFAPVAVIVAFVSGLLLGGSGDAWSAALGVTVVVANLIAFAVSLSWASRISPIAVYAVGLGGFVIRMMVFLVLLATLDRVAWFSPVAFVAAFVPTTIALLAVELKVLSGRRLQADLWYFREEAR
jgi:ATP synthase protein I